jgi:hypothetical protein
MRLTRELTVSPLRSVNGIPGVRKSAGATANSHKRITSNRDFSTPLPSDQTTPSSCAFGSSTVSNFFFYFLFKLT